MSAKARGDGTKHNSPSDITEIDRLFRELNPALLDELSRSGCAQWADIEDIVQNAWAAMLDHWSGIGSRDAGCVLRYLEVTARHGVRQTRQSGAARVARERRYASETQGGNRKSNVCDSVDVLDAVLAVLEDVSAEVALALRLHYLDELTLGDAGRRMGRSAAAVAMLCCRGRAVVRGARTM